LLYPSEMRRHSRVLLAVLLGVGTQRVAAQGTDVATRAYAFGWSPAAGLLGVEWVARSFSAAPRLGGAAGVGLGGVGVRLNVTLREPRTHNRIPYLAVGYVMTPWVPAVKLTSVTSIEGGLQFWPANPRRLYVDLGAGVGFLSGAASNVGPVLRFLVGRTF
jgi:hypothetical protein